MHVLSQVTLHLDRLGFPIHLQISMEMDAEIQMKIPMMITMVSKMRQMIVQQSLVHPPLEHKVVWIRMETTGRIQVTIVLLKQVIPQKAD